MTRPTGPRAAYEHHPRFCDFTVYVGGEYWARTTNEVKAAAITAALNNMTWQQYDEAVAPVVYRAERKTA